MAQKSKKLRRLDHQPYPYDVESVFLDFSLGEEVTTVESEILFRRKPDMPRKFPLVLNIGQKVELLSLAVDEKFVSFHRDGENLVVLSEVPESFWLKAKTRISPIGNTALEGLYASNGILITQCEAESFRNITLYPDRPDVLSVFTVRMTADRGKYPVLLSNGNGYCGEGDAIVYNDPFPKPCYLFALVACDFPCIEDEFVTMSGRTIRLQIYAKEQFLPQLDFAMRCLKQAMKWDEMHYGREYDLDTFMIVGTEDFNMGAMENKGLNIFNLKFIVADPTTATDERLLFVQGVIAHEYFHNWTGNRITCRDWFQLSLKEGFTVFRDQEFSSDMGSRLVKRIEDVNVLREKQFKQDAGPLAHPVRPDEAEEISNFYTVTVYQKGAEVVRMQQTILEEEMFRKGTDLYFERHDGQAVTCEDFVKVMEDASGVDLGQFRNWYSQAGTPVLDVMGMYDEAAKQFALHVKQSCPVTHGQPTKEPFHIPLRFGLLGKDGKDIQAGLLHVTKPEETFVFEDVSVKPIVSLNRNFSTPVIVNYPYTKKELLFLVQHDSDHFNRWDAGQRLASEALLDLVKDYHNSREMVLDEGFLKIYAKLLADKSIDNALLAEMLVLPSEEELARQCEVIDPEAIHAVREFAKREVADTFSHELLEIYKKNSISESYSFDSVSIAKRRLKNVALEYLSSLSRAGLVLIMSTEQFKNAANMTDEMSALSCIVNMPSKMAREPENWALQMFYEKWHHDPNVLDSWFSVQAKCPLPGATERVKKLMQHSDFLLKNPNRVRALIGVFVNENPTHFHATSGEGYKLLADVILKLDPINQQTAARLVEPLLEWKRYRKHYQKLMKKELARLSKARLSKGVMEKVTKSLAF